MSTFLCGDCTDMTGGIVTLWAATLFIIVPCAWAGWCSWWVLAWPLVLILGIAVVWWVCFIFLAKFFGAIFGVIFK